MLVRYSTISLFIDFFQLFRREISVVPSQHKFRYSSTKSIHISLIWAILHDERISNKEWSERVFKQMQDRIDLREIGAVFFHAGDKYRKYLIPKLERIGIKCEVPLKNLSIGKQLEWYSELSQNVHKGGGDMGKPSFREVWKRIIACEGEEFRTVTNLPFTYEVRGKLLRPSRTAYNISKSDFAKAYELVPLDGPGQISKLVRGPSYIWAILHDERISKGE